ncbi:MAG: IS630 family transposase [Candidatus Competibacteraceae bacterium]|nr:IS630 family transposase [Candidatus Competibacteraceae bacterium]
MGRKRAELDVHGEGGKVLLLLKKEDLAWRLERLRAIQLGLEGELNLGRIATATGKARSTIQEWFDLFREGGLAALLAGQRVGASGPDSDLTAEAEQGLREALAQGRFRTGPQVQRWLCEEHGIEVAMSTVYKYLGKIGARLRVPRPVQIKKDPQAADRFKADLGARLRSIDLPRKRPVRLWVADEMRVGLHSFTRRVWGLPGIRPSTTVQQKYQWGYCWGAVEVGRGGSAFMYTDTVSLDWNQAFLAQIARYDTGAEHIVIYDGAGFHHRPGDPRLPSHVHPLILPPYSPELNPVEKLWDQAKDVLCNHAYPMMEALWEDLSTFLHPFWSNPRRPLSLIGKTSYLLLSANSYGDTVLPIK